MGVQFDRVLDGFTGPFEKVTDWNLPIPPPITGAGRSTRCERAKNDCFIALNRLFKNATEGRSDGSPILANPRYFGVGPDAAGTPVRAARIGLWDQYGGSMESGWTRWILEQFEFPFTRVFAPELDAGNLNAKYDVLVFVERRDPGRARGGRWHRWWRARRTRRRRRRARPADDSRGVPLAARTRDGRPDDPADPRVHRERRHGDRAQRFGDEPGRSPQAADREPPGRERRADPAREVLRPRLGAEREGRHQPPARRGHERAHRLLLRQQPGVQARTRAPRPRASARSRASIHRRRCAAAGRGGSSISNGGVVAIEAKLGKGRVVLYGPEILQRAQPHGTFKLLFNALYAGSQ